MVKKARRKIFLTHLESLTKEQLQANSLAACGLLSEAAEFRSARCVMFFLSLVQELDTSFALEAAFMQGKRVLVPHIDWEAWRLAPYVMPDKDCPMETGRYGLRYLVDGEPAAVADIDLVIVPGLGFDESGYRLGRGGGFYDRFLSQVDFRGVSCGIAFEQQVVEEVPTELHDVRLDMLVTDKRVRRFDNHHKDHI